MEAGWTHFGHMVHIVIQQFFYYPLVQERFGASDVGTNMPFSPLTYSIRHYNPSIRITT